MSIPILRLPFLALKVVMDSLKIVDLLAISLCSKRVERVIKTCRLKPSVFNVDSEVFNVDYYYDDMKRFDDLEKLQLLLLEAGNPGIKEKLGEGKTSLDVVVSDVISLKFHVGWHIQFRLQIEEISQMENFEGYMKVLNIDGTNVPFMLTRYQLHTFWDDRVLGLQFFVKYFETNFCLEKCYWRFENSAQDLKPLVAYLNSLPSESEDGLRVKKVTVLSVANLSHSDYKYILETVTHKLNAEMNVPKEFEFSGKFATKNLTLASAHWFTLEHLFNCNCESIRVRGSKITTNKDLKMFIWKWSDGELSHFKKVELQLENEVKIDFILERMNIVGDYSSHSKMIQDKNGERAMVDGEYQKFVFIKVNE
ncbi:unnamed protein product [Caenorhabditis brenneri]